MRRVIPVAVATAAFLTSLFAPPGSATPSSLGTITVSGATAGRYRLTRSGECSTSTYSATGVGVTLSGSYRGVVGGVPTYGGPELYVTHYRAGRTQRVNLGRTKDFVLEFRDAAGTTTWQSGWTSTTAKSARQHIGSGTLSMTSNGRSGSATTEMSRYTGSLRGHVHLTVNWRCA